VELVEGGKGKENDRTSTIPLNTTSMKGEDITICIKAIEIWGVGRG
jgi:hypothetical protein